MTRPSFVSFVALACMLVPACGTAAELSRDDHQRDDRALSVRADHDEVVRMAGDPEGRAAEGEDCPEACLRRDRVHQLAERICDVAQHDDHDEATQFLCEDARERSAGTQRRAEGCGCS